MEQSNPAAAHGIPARLFAVRLLRPPGPRQPHQHGERCGEPVQ
ncbi:hypothetical protein [Streptomyces cyaneofuscatus]